MKLLVLVLAEDEYDWRVWVFKERKKSSTCGPFRVMMIELDCDNHQVGAKITSFYKRFSGKVLSICPMYF